MCSKRCPLLVLFAIVLPAASTGAFGFQKEFSETVPFSPGDRISLKTYKGSIHLSSWERPEVSVFARITPPEGEDDAYASAVVEATAIEVQQRDGLLIIRSDYDNVPSKRSWWNNSKNLAFVHYEIKTPRQVDIQLEDYKSSIELYELSGEIDLETYKGKVKGTDLSGRLHLDTYKGVVELSALQGSLDVETYKGEVSIQAIQIDGSSRLETYKGSIKLSIPETQGLSVSADLGRRGHLGGDFTLGVERDSEPRRRHRKARKFSGEINQGGPRLEVSTYKGDIRLTRW